MTKGSWYFERLGAVVLQRDMDRRIRGFARGCADAVVLAHVSGTERVAGGGDRG